MRGVTIAEKTRVLGVDVEESPRGRRVTGVRVERDGDEQRVETEIVVNCAGQWAKALGDQVGVTIPLHSAEHFYVVTEAVAGTQPDLPIMRDPDGSTNFKEEVGGLVVGGFEPDAKPWRAPDDRPNPFEFQLLEDDWKHFGAADGGGADPGAGAGRDRHPQVLQRPGVVHARQPVPARGSTGARRLLRRCRVQLGGDRLAGGAGLARRSGSSR